VVAAHGDAVKLGAGPRSAASKLNCCIRLGRPSTQMEWCACTARARAQHGFALCDVARVYRMVPTAPTRDSHQTTSVSLIRIADDVAVSLEWRTASGSCCTEMARLRPRCSVLCQRGWRHKAITQPHMVCWLHATRQGKRGSLTMSNRWRVPSETHCETVVQQHSHFLRGRMHEPRSQ
jgi:hypothetical protein